MMRGAIFDLDGTLLDSMEIWDTIGASYLKSIGCEPRADVNETVAAMSLYQAACYFQQEYGVSLSAEEIMDGVNAMVEQYYREAAPLKPGAAEFLQNLSRNGVKMCIATATDRFLVEAALVRCGVRQYFSEIFTCTAVGHGKDEPVIYREAQKHLGTEQSQTVVFEDALHALKTAKNDGFPTVAVYDCHEKQQEKIAALADFYLTDFRELGLFWKQMG